MTESTRTKIARIGIIVALGIGVATTIVIFRRNDPVSKYWAFMNHDRAYFAQIAEACETLTPYLPAGAMTVETVDVKDKRVLPIIQKLRPDFVELREKQVYVGFGMGRAAWGFIWAANDFDPRNWELHANADGKDTLLLSTNVSRSFSLLSTNTP